MPPDEIAIASPSQRFERVRELGVGGFGVVYEAIDRRDGGRVALKVSSPQVVSPFGQ